MLTTYEYLSISPFNLFSVSIRYVLGNFSFIIESFATQWTTDLLFFTAFDPYMAIEITLHSICFCAIWTLKRACWKKNFKVRDECYINTRNYEFF